ncbi:hypothetical protein A2397_03830 [Candidatus Amesbacteria bacterium RIFOXYB1_FULL_44_23]|uniref:Uncharacterized protein n=1 Tax=Candidatus Amesbacteria bacterium RIFOXYB1_FULL_44_23 TaxID=1797263 RepID=A0A1F4ZWC0_9BACT|nr:MAG: hypothetical protein A2397_03830 [Candidatus Amesbacteria bacterium RIFOXYB1_FULL_44_23]
MTKLLAQGDVIDVFNRSTDYDFINDLTPSDYVITAGSVLLGMSGVLGFIFLLWGGVQWIMAGGDKDSVEKARKKITTALIGLAVVFSVYAFMYIIRTLFGTPAGFTLDRLGTP